MEEVVAVPVVKAEMKLCEPTVMSSAYWCSWDGRGRRRWLGVMAAAGEEVACYRIPCDSGSTYVEARGIISTGVIQVRQGGPDLTNKFVSKRKLFFSQSKINCFRKFGIPSTSTRWDLSKNAIKTYKKWSPASWWTTSTILSRRQLHFHLQKCSDRIPFVANNAIGASRGPVYLVTTI